MNITETSYRLGFSDTSHFIGEFSRRLSIGNSFTRQGIKWNRRALAGVVSAYRRDPSFRDPQGRLAGKE